MKIIALIPARKGSKGILNKNMQLLNNMPLVEYTIQAAIKATLVDEIWLSSDDPKILAIGKSYNLNIIERPKILSSDSASAEEVVKHFLSYLPKNVIYRPKSGFGAPLRHWMRYELRELLHDLLSENSIQKRGIFEPSAVRILIEANDSGKLDASYTLFSILCIEMWCRRFLDKQVSA